MHEKDLYGKALRFATEKHKGQFRKGGEEYITHPIAVAKMLEDKGFGIEYILTGLFHDLLEDTNATDEQILELGGEAVLKAVKLLTKKENYVMSEYFSGILSSPIAREVKIADSVHNLTCATVADEEFKIRYIRETVEWYWELSPEIRQAAKRLARGLITRLAEYPFLYE